MAGMDVWGPIHGKRRRTGDCKCDMAMQDILIKCCALIVWAFPRLRQATADLEPLVALSALCHCQVLLTRSGKYILPADTISFVLWSRRCPSLADGDMHGQVHQQQMRC